jgi:hypothetical protein
MAYLSGFEHDVFLSYSHGHPRSTRKALKEWTLELIRKLEEDIWEIEEFEKFDIWRDEQFDPTLQLTPGLKATVKSSAIIFKLAWGGQ